MDHGRRRWFYAALAIGLIGSSWSVRAMQGAWSNNLVGAFAAVAILTGLALHLLRGWSREAAAGNGAQRGALLETGVWLAVALQFVLLIYDPREQLPSQADRVAGEHLVEVLRSIDGDVFIPHHGYLALAAGHRSYAHILGMDNVFLDDPDGYGARLRAELGEAVRRRGFAAVVVESDGRLSQQVRGSYLPSIRLLPDPGVFWPVSGGRLRPEILFVPKPLN